MYVYNALPVPLATRLRLKRSANDLDQGLLHLMGLVMLPVHHSIMMEVIVRLLTQIMNLLTVTKQLQYMYI